MISVLLSFLIVEEDGIIKRTVYPEVPPRVEYEISEEGKSIIPLIEAIAHWGRTKAESEGKLVEIEE